MKYVLASLAIIAALTACDDCPQDRQAMVDQYCKPQLVTTTPTGVQLWMLSRQCPNTPNAYDVYFTGLGVATNNKRH